MQHPDNASALDNRAQTFTIVLMTYFRTAFLPGSYYHIFSRGNRKQAIFFGDRDYLRFLEKVEEYRKKYNIDLVAFCLIPNHFHLLVRQNSEVPVPKFMGVLLSSHSHYTSIKHDLPRGQLFQGRFGKTLIETESSLLQVSRYIHLNPIKEKLLDMDITFQKSRTIRDKETIKYLHGYRWSSYPLYLSNQASNGVISIDAHHILSLEKSRASYRRFVESKISDEDFRNLENLEQN